MHLRAPGLPVSERLQGVQVRNAGVKGETMKDSSRLKVQGSRLKSAVYAAIVVAQVALIVACIFYGILAECDLREFRQSDRWWAWQHERALAEHYAERSR